MEWKWKKYVVGDILNSREVSPATIYEEDGEPVSLFHGSKDYTCRLDGCECERFIKGNKSSKPCKHMIRLATDLGLFDGKAKSEELLLASYASTAVVTPHKTLHSITWRIIDIEEDDDVYATLWADPIACMPFFDLRNCNEARYIRTDFSGKSTNNGILLRVQEKGGNESGDYGAARRYEDIMAYGSNQWPVSTLREYLNGSFFDGLPANFQNAVIPQKHTMLLRKVLSTVSSNLTTPAQAYSDSVLVYDKFTGDGLRFTYADVTDSVFLPSVDADAKCARYFSIPDNMIQPSHYWLMDSHVDLDGVPYLVKIVCNCLDTRGKRYAVVQDANARMENIFVCPMCVVKMDYLKKILGERIDRKKEISV